MTKGKQVNLRDERLYPTEGEEQKLRQLKERYGLRDSVVVKGDTDSVIPKRKKNSKK